MFMQAAAEEGSLIQSMQEAKANLTGTMKTFENQTCASDIAAAFAAHRLKHTHAGNPNVRKNLARHSGGITQTVLANYKLKTCSARRQSILFQGSTLALTHTKVWVLTVACTYSTFERLLAAGAIRKQPVSRSSAPAMRNVGTTQTNFKSRSPQISNYKHWHLQSFQMSRHSSRNMWFTLE